MAHSGTTGQALVGASLFLVVTAASWRLMLPAVFGPDRGGSRTGFGGRHHYYWSVALLVVFATVGAGMVTGGIIGLLF